MDEIFLVEIRPLIKKENTSNHPATAAYKYLNLMKKYPATKIRSIPSK